ncbi:SsrA-binding protein SmpB [Myxococcota bacterium]|nr:SsrA-binding protein SmpB [Myxococcota bacterium]MBU1433021.1 SsrA-binding protein SmpB [Myxococcota bacterium]MBU1899944.1 SsrA-binding protein SmpB [Myxococcota bacterium]
MSKKRPDEIIIARNRRARHDYELLQVFEAGLVLTGTEVKSLRQGRASIGEGYVTVLDGEAFLMGAHIPPYVHGNRFNHEPVRPRKLLLKIREIARLDLKLREQGLTCVPTQLYFKLGWAKLEFALARGRKSYDKRYSELEKINRREARSFSPKI